MSIPATISDRRGVGVSPWAIGGLRVARERIRIEPYEGLDLVIATETSSGAVVCLDLVASSVTDSELLHRVVNALTTPRRAPRRQPAAALQAGGPRALRGRTPSAGERAAGASSRSAPFHATSPPQLRRGANGRCSIGVPR